VRRCRASSAPYALSRVPFPLLSVYSKNNFMSNCLARRHAPQAFFSFLRPRVTRFGVPCRWIHPFFPPFKHRIRSPFPLWFDSHPWIFFRKIYFPFFFPARHFSFIEVLPFSRVCRRCALLLLLENVRFLSFPMNSPFASSFCRSGSLLCSFPFANEYFVFSAPWVSFEIVLDPFPFP